MNTDSGKQRLWPRLKWWAVGFFGQFLVRLLYLTVRGRETGLENLAAGRKSGPGPVIYAIWHGRLLGNCYNNRNQNICVMVSRHRDGEIIARIVERLGFSTARGSETRGSTSALKTMLRVFRSSHDLGFTVDGPRGPAGTVKPGVILAAARSGCPIVPLTVGYSRCWKLPSWDRFKIPKPFCRMIVAYGKPITVPKEVAETDLDMFAREVAAGINLISRLADNLTHPVERPGFAPFAAAAERFLNRERDHWYLLPPLVLLVPLEWIYRVAWRIRDELYNRGFLKVSPAPVPTVCVGSLYLGGAGKTPVAIMLAKRLAARGARPAVLTRGYGSAQTDLPQPLIIHPREKAARRPAEIAELAGDEAALAWLRLGNVGIAVSADRAAGAAAAVERLGAHVLIMDNGFGHRRFGRSMDLLLVNGRLLKLTGHLLPAGALREPYAAARRARALVINSRSGEPGIELPGWAAALEPILVRRSVSGLVRLESWLRGETRDRLKPEKILHGKQVLAFCGIARPDGFRETLMQLDPEHLELIAFADHCRYSEQTQSELAERARLLGAILVTTEKDAVKLDPGLIGRHCLVLCLAYQPADEAALEALLDELLAT